MDTVSAYRRSSEERAVVVGADIPAPASGFESLVEHELSLPEGSVKRGNKNWLVFPPRDIAGLALSGGGIRSATFNLGLLQGLDELGLLKAFDYLSTVSGGGYIGGFWTAWRSRPERVDGDTFPSALQANGSEAQEVRHLREFSNFLSPRLGMLSYDTGRMLVASLSSTLPALFAALAMVVLIAIAWLGLTWLLMRPVDALEAERGAAWSAAVLGSVSAATYAGFEIAWRKRGEQAPVLPYALASLAGVALIVLAWLVFFFPRFLSWTPYSVPLPPAPPLCLAPHASLPLLCVPASARWVYLLAPAGAWTFAAFVLLYPRWLSSRLSGDHLQPGRAAFDRVASRTLFLVAAWVALAALWYIALMLQGAVGANERTATGYGGITALFGIVFAALQKLLSRSHQTSAGSSLLARLRPVLPQLLAYATVALAVVGMMLLILFAAQERSESTLMVTALTVTLLVLVFFDPNRIGLHAFYRARIACAYLGASNARGRPSGARHATSADAAFATRSTTEEQPGDDMPINDESLRRLVRPRHLICCAANDLAPVNPLINLYRGADSAVLSSVAFSIGSEWSLWRKDLHVPTLAAAITASGAAFNSHMGAKSVQLGPAVTFLMTALNLRLGIWLRHPKRWTRRALDWPVGAKLYREMFGLSRARSRHVLLSDGGHFENMGLYELIRRHCRYVVASDCGMDSDVAFDDFGNLVRKVREDFGVEIDIDLAPLRRGPDGLARQPMVAGDIHYPDGDTGVLLLFKPALVGSEPADISQYSRRNKAFPHETTGDQFYDEAQWESYRRLGRHAAHSAFGRISGSANGGERDAWDVFARARRDWLAIRPGFEQRVERFAVGIAEIDGLLHREDCSTLLRQVYKEIDELDRQTVRRSAPAGAGEGSPRATLPDPKDLASSLHTIRRALLLMEEVYLSENLAAQHNHPLYLGVINYFARWAYAPLFRMWWPLLKSMYSSGFTDFLENRFGLAAVGIGSDAAERVIAGLGKRDSGFAMSCWTLAAGRAPGEGEHLVSYELAMQYQNFEPYRVQAAQVIVRFAERAALWDSRDFYVPPGLWGTGIGGDFLDRLEHAPTSLFNAKYLVVRIELEQGASRKARADETQLYRSRGFAEATIRNDRIELGSFSLSRDAIAANAPTPITNLADSRWLVRAVSSPAVADR